MRERNPSSVTSSYSNVNSRLQYNSSTTYKLVFLTTNVWHIHVVGRWAKFFELLSGKDVNGNQMDLGVTVLSGLGGAHLDNLAWTILDDNVPVLAQSRALHRVRGGGAGVGGLEGVLLMLEKRLANCVQAKPPEAK
jgi:hypothetical protein